MFSNSWFKKEKPLPSMIGLGGGATSLQQNAGGPDEWKLFLMGAGGGFNPNTYSPEPGPNKGGGGAVVVVSFATVLATDVFHCYVGKQGQGANDPYQPILNPIPFGGSTAGQGNTGGGGGGFAAVVMNGPIPAAPTAPDPTVHYIAAIAGGGGGAAYRGGGSGGGQLQIPNSPAGPGPTDYPVPGWINTGSRAEPHGGGGGGSGGFHNDGGAGGLGAPGPGSPGGKGGHLYGGGGGGGQSQNPGGSGGGGWYGGGGGGGGSWNMGAGGAGGGSSYVHPSWTAELLTVGYYQPTYHSYSWVAQPGTIGPGGTGAGVPATYHPYYSTPTDPQMKYYGWGAPQPNPYFHGPGTTHYGGRSRIVLENVTKGYKRTVNFTGAVELVPAIEGSSGLDFSLNSYSTTGGQDKYKQGLGWGYWSPGTRNSQLVASHANSGGFGMEFNFSGPNSTFTDFEVMSCQGGGGSFVGNFNSDSPFPMTTGAEPTGMASSGSLAPNLPGGNVTKFTITTSGNSTNASIQVMAIKVNGKIIDFGQNWI